MSLKEITHTFYFSCTPSEIISAITNGDQIQNWWTRDAQVKSGKGTFQWKEHGWIVELTLEKLNDRKVIWTCTKSNMQDTNAWEGSKMTFELVSENSGTKLNFKHSNYKNSPCYQVCHEGWRFVLGKSLKSYLENGKGIPYG